MPGLNQDRHGGALLDLVEVMDRLRAECPWTREQTHLSLRRYVLEEAHETVDAIDSGDDAHLREELGDLLMQVVIHAAVAADNEGWDIDDVARGITEKLIERNPHVFADAVATTAAEVDANWQRIKSERRAADAGGPAADPLASIPTTLPALNYADKVLRRFPEARIEPVPGDDPGARLGAELLRLVAQARDEGIDAEHALRAAARRAAGV